MRACKERINKGNKQNSRKADGKRYFERKLSRDGMKNNSQEKYQEVSGKRKIEFWLERE